MSSPSRRRRSQSASGHFSFSSSSPQLARKVAAKRSFPQHLSSPLKESPAVHKWDVDSYRRGKRRRKAASAGSDASRNRAGGFPQNATFAVSSKDFGLPLVKPRNRERSWRSTVMATSPLTDARDTQSYDGMRGLRSRAFWELQRSVAENGEGLVRRMQEQEHQRSWDERGRSLCLPMSSTIFPTPQYPLHSDVSGDEDDEIHIYAREPSDWFSSRASTSHDVMMDTDSSPSPGSSDVSSVPVGVHLGQDSLSPLTSLTSSPMSEAACDPASSPDPSLVFPQSAPANTLYFGTSHESLGAEKAIDALALELAGGAGGIHDYTTLASRREDFNDIEICDAGELWS